MNPNSAPNIKGPSVNTPNNAYDIPIPDCVSIQSEADNAAFQAFIEKVLRAAQENALNEIATYVAAQNDAMTRLVKKLGAT